MAVGSGALLSAAMYSLASHGLTINLPELQTAVLPGLVVGLLGLGVFDAAAGAAVGTILTALAFPIWTLAEPPLGVRLGYAMAFAVGAAATAAALSWALARRGRTVRRWIGLAIVLVIALNFFATGLVINENLPRVGGGDQPRTLNEWLRQEPAARTYDYDEALYLREYYLMKSGVPYYEAFKTAAEGDTKMTGIPGVLGYRLPTLFYAWKWAPGDATALPLMLMALVVFAAVGWYGAASELVPAAIAVVSSAAISVYLLTYTVYTSVTFSEPWAACFAILSLSALLMSERNDDQARAWLWGSAVAALLAFLVREHMAMLLMAGLALALSEGTRRGRRDWLVWAAALGVATTAYALHASQVPAQTVATSGSALALWLRGGPDFVWAMLTTGANYFAGGIVLPAFALVGIVGVVLAPRGLRIFLGISTLVPLTMYFFVGSEVRTVAANARVAPWAPTVIPLLLAAVVFALHAVTDRKAWAAVNDRH